MATLTDWEKKRFLSALRKSRGNLTEACRLTKLKRYHVRRAIEADEELKLEVQEVQEEVGDFIEDALMKLIAKRNTSAVIFACKTKLKDRGYTEKQQIDHTSKDDKININIISPEENKKPEE